MGTGMPIGRCIDNSNISVCMARPPQCRRWQKPRDWNWRRHAAVIHRLWSHSYDFLVLFPVNPLTVAKYREAFTPSRAKDDPTDAELQVALLLKHRDKLQPLQPQSPAMRALAQLVEHRRRLVGDKVRITNRLTSALKNYFPQVLQWFQDKDTRIFG